MNTLLNIFSELSLAFCFKMRAFGQPDYFKQREITLSFIKKIPLHRRITQRGNAEQYQNKFLTNYYGEKRLSKSHIFTANNV